MKDLNKLLKIIKRSNKAAAKTINKELEDLYNTFKDDLPEELFKYDRTTLLKEKIKNVLQDNYKAVELVILDHLQNTLKYNADKVFEETNKVLASKKILAIPFKYDSKDILFSQDTGLVWTERLGITRDKAIREIQEATIQGIKKGKLLKDVSKDIQDRLSVSTSRANKIARTETHRVLCDVRHKRFTDIEEATNGQFMKKWVTSKDERVRSSHSELDGVTIPINSYFEIGGHKALYPTDFGEPSLDINCRCITVLVPRNDLKGS